MLPNASSSSVESGLMGGGGGINGGPPGKGGGQQDKNDGGVLNFDPGLPRPGAGGGGVGNCKFGGENLAFVQLVLFRGDWEDFSLSSVEYGVSFSFSPECPIPFTVSSLGGGSRSDRFCSS